MNNKPLSFQELQAAHELGEAIVRLVKAMTVQPQDKPQPIPTPIPPQQPPAQPEKELLSIQEAAQLMNVSTKTLWSRSFPRGSIRTVRIGSRVLYPRTMLMQWIAQNAQR
jgi:excisionase family DNA binding protein